MLLKVTDCCSQPNMKVFCAVISDYLFTFNLSIISRLVAHKVEVRVKIPCRNFAQELYQVIASTVSSINFKHIFSSRCVVHLRSLSLS